MENIIAHAGDFVEYMAVFSVKLSKQYMTYPQDTQQKWQKLMEQYLMLCTSLCTMNHFLRIVTI
jgi:phenylalanine-4-hydroxylase